MQGKTDDCPQRLPLVIIAIAWAGGTFATAVLALLALLVLLVLLGNWQNIAMILGSFGASCLLIFAYPESPFAQPRNIVSGHLITTFVIIITASVMKICAILG